jgi:hypothetical protein
MALHTSILIALPTTNQTMKSATAITVAQTVKTLLESGVEVELHNIDSAEIVTARDMFTNMLLYTDAWTSVLFVDSDMQFDPSLIMRMIQLQADVVGAAYPRRTLDLPKLLSCYGDHQNLGRAVAQASSFTCKLHWDEDDEHKVEVRDGFRKAAAVGMGCALISKSALQEMISARVVRPRLDLNAGEGRTCWSFFENIEQGESRLGEDYSFCYRWTEMMKRDLWIAVDDAVSHIGSYSYTARFSDLFHS